MVYDSEVERRKAVYTLMWIAGAVGMVVGIILSIIVWAIFPA